MGQPRVVERLRDRSLADPEAALRSVPFLAELPAGDLEFLVPHVQLVEFDAEEIVVEEGRPWDRLLILRRGQCEVYKSRGGLWKQVLSKVGPGQPLLLVPVLDQLPAPASVRALRRGTALAIDAAAVRRLLAASPSFAFHLLVRLAARVRSLVCLSGELSLLTLEERLVRFLLRHAPLAEEDDGEDGHWQFTHEEVASLLGGCREEITRLLSKLKKKGLITTGRRRVHIVDHDGLRRMAPRLPGSDLD